MSGRFTKEISSQIDGIQSATREAMKAIGGIDATINDVEEISMIIFSVVKEHGEATQEIARAADEHSAQSDVTSRAGRTLPGAAQNGITVTLKLTYLNV